MVRLAVQTQTDLNAQRICASHHAQCSASCSSCRLRSSERSAKGVTARHRSSENRLYFLSV